MDANSYSIPKPSTPNHVLSALGLLGCLLIFAILLAITYVPERKEPARVSKFRTEEGDPPTAKELRDQEAEMATTYGWINESKGEVRIPLLRAKELFVVETQKGS